ncbi:hypothetical protein ETAE_0564 [Edwardsiella piscicida]|uniref:Uncharacterized protein n=1 Tax=Edwardsiella piscicida TaxID=1263550 RepID=A0AAU8P1C3_EDWPI|nr:hypothetical protein ETAE_0564 [Edwardsiella tarda EIB202]
MESTVFYFVTPISANFIQHEYLDNRNLKNKTMGNWQSIAI